MLKYFSLYKMSEYTIEQCDNFIILRVKESSIF